jgi:IMP dehydrogenase
VQTALHLMRTGAVGLVGVGPGAACTTRGVLGVGVPGDLIADAAGARMEHLRRPLRPGDRRWGCVPEATCQASRAGADAVMIGSLAKAYEAPGGVPLGDGDLPPDLPRGARVQTKQIGSWRRSWWGRRTRTTEPEPVRRARTSMATTGYANVREFQKAEIVVAPAIKTEGKADQRAQHVGMGG